MRPNGEHVWVLATTTFVRDDHGRGVCWLGQFQDITELRRLASRDPLTDTLNRRAFHHELRARAGRRAADARPRRLQGHQRRARPRGGRRCLRVIAGAIGRRLRRDDVLAPARRRRVRRAPPALLDGRGDPRSVGSGRDRGRSAVPSRRVEPGVIASIGLSPVDVGDTPADGAGAPTARCTRRRPSAAATVLAARSRVGHAPASAAACRAGGDDCGSAVRCAARSGRSASSRRAASGPGCSLARDPRPSRGYGAVRAGPRPVIRARCEDALADRPPGLAAVALLGLAAPAHHADDLQGRRRGRPSPRLPLSPGQDWDLFGVGPSCRGGSSGAAGACSRPLHGAVRHDCWLARARRCGDVGVGAGHAAPDRRGRLAVGGRVAASRSGRRR